MKFYKEISRSVISHFILDYDTFLENFSFIHITLATVALNLILYGPCIILQYVRNPTRYTIFDY